MTNIFFLIQKATGEKLSWLKNVKEMYGSVETSSLKRAQTINLKGVYKVGAGQSQKCTVENSLVLNIPKGDENIFRNISSDTGRICLCL